MPGRIRDAAEHRDAAVDRFKRTGGAPPAGVKIVARWHAVGPIAGFANAEAADPVAIQKWVLNWSDVLSLEVHPALTDEQLGQALTSV